MEKINITPEWKALESHAQAMHAFHTCNAFKEDKERFQQFHIKLEGLLFDYSKQRITDTTLQHLVALAKKSGLEDWRERLFSGAEINHTEQRSVLHTALRDQSDEPLIVDGVDVKTGINAVLQKMDTFIHQVHSGEWKGFTGKTINTIVNIGIGGSDLGPKMLYRALSPFHVPGINVVFISNLDGADLASELQNIDPETTLFTIASKTFTTLETMQNAQSARTWFLRHANSEQDIAKHFVAISTNVEKVAAFGIDTNNMFEFWDWVGGRYSLWSAIGLPLALGVGMHHFNALLEGAYTMDRHFQEAPLAENIPVLMGLIGVWNRNFLKADSLAVLPYDHLLEYLPDFLQQLDMESNGKYVDRDGDAVDYATGPIVWGATGNNGQHAFFQLLHQSDTLTPIDFIGTVNSPFAIPGHQERLFANMLAQAEALMCGRSHDAVMAEAKTEHERLVVPYRVFKGNVPSSLLLFDNITPYNLGMLVALYEHKVFVQGVIWHLNAYDQWGVELGKALAKHILHDLTNSEDASEHDASTEGLMQYFKQHFMDTLGS
jgi:glucose-6-phosphate isomerase